MNIVGNVYSTYDYSRFKKLQGNRDVFEERKKLIMQSIAERGWIRNPIVVNKNMEIIDGQGRFEALMELSMPIEYIVADNATIDDCIALNLKQKNWTTNDFIECYARQGKQSYLTLKDVIEKYPNLNITVISLLCGRNILEGGPILNEIKSGKYEIYDIGNLFKRLDFVSNCLDVVGKDFGRRGLWASIFRFIFYSDNIDNKTFIEKLKKYKGCLYSSSRVDQTLKICSDIYNKNNKKYKVYFEKEFDEYKKSMATTRETLRSLNGGGQK